MDNLILKKLSEGFKFFHKKNTPEQQAEFRQQLERNLMQILSELKSNTPEQIEHRQALVNEVLEAIQNHSNQKASSSTLQTAKVEALEQLLLPICRLIHLEENNGNPKEQAWKLAVTFPDFEATMNYLSYRLTTNKAKDTRPVLHDACLYALSTKSSKEQIANWDSLSKWQQLAKDNMHDPEFRELLAHAPDVELLIKQEAQKAWQQAKKDNAKAKFGASNQPQKQEIKIREHEITALQKRYKDIKNKRINPSKFGRYSLDDDDFYKNYSKKLNDAMIALAKAYQCVGFKNANIGMIKAFYATYKATAKKEFAFFLKQGLTKQNYAKFIALQCIDDDTRIPPIRIDGQVIGENGYYLRRLNVENTADATIAASLGKLSGCCQSLSGEAGEPCVIHGLTSREGGFYMICKGDASHPTLDDELIAQSWVWRSQSGAMVIDSVESKYNDKVTHDRTRKFYHALSTELLMGDYAIPMISHGAYSGISRSIATSPIPTNEQPIDYNGYRDSLTQNMLVSKESLFLLPNNAALFVAKLEDCKSLKAIKFIEHALKKDNKGFLLTFKDRFKESGQAVIETCAAYLDMLDKKQDEITLETISTLHQKAADVLIISNNKEQNIFHIKATNPEHLKVILGLYSKEQLSDALKMVDKEGNTPLHIAASNPESLKIILDLSPQEQRLDTIKVVNKYGDTTLHKAASNPESLKLLLDLYPQNQRLDAIKVRNKLGNTPLHKAASNPESLKIILDLYPQNQRLDVVKAANKYGVTLLHMAASNPESLKIILDLYPQNQRLEAIKLAEEYDFTPLNLAISKPDSLKVILDSLTNTDKLKAIDDLASTSLEPEAQAIIDEVKRSATQTDASNPHRLFSPSEEKNSSESHKNEQKSEDVPTHKAPPPTTY